MRNLSPEGTTAPQWSDRGFHKELAYFEGFLRTVMGKLSNERFVANAPAAVVENERNKQRDAEAKIAALKERIAALKN